jgi:hypothetical protein
MPHAILLLETLPEELVSIRKNPGTSLFEIRTGTSNCLPLRRKNVNYYKYLPYSPALRKVAV